MIDSAGEVKNWLASLLKVGGVCAAGNTGLSGATGGTGGTGPSGETGIAKR